MGTLSPVCTHTPHTLRAPLTDTTPGWSRGAGTAGGSAPWTGSWRAHAGGLAALPSAWESEWPCRGWEPRWRAPVPTLSDTGLRKGDRGLLPKPGSHPPHRRHGSNWCGFLKLLSQSTLVGPPGTHSETRVDAGCIPDAMPGPEEAGAVTGGADENSSVRVCRDTDLHPTLEAHESLQFLLKIWLNPTHPGCSSPSPPSHFAPPP